MLISGSGVGHTRIALAAACSKRETFVAACWSRVEATKRQALARNSAEGVCEHVATYCASSTA